MTAAMRFDAVRLAGGWLAVALAASDDDDRPVLYRSVNIECFPHGVRLVATDGYLLLAAWVPTLWGDEEPVPDMDEAPLSTVTLIDPERRASALLGHLFKIGTAKDAPIVEVTLAVVSAEDLDEDDEDDEAPLTLEGFEAWRGVLERPGSERLTLRTFDGPFPNMRALLAGLTPISTDQLTLSPELLGRLTKVAKWFPDALIGWKFTGEGRPALIEFMLTKPVVISGAFASVRHEF